MTKNMLILVSIIIGIMVIALFIASRNYNKLLGQADQMYYQLHGPPNPQPST